VADLTHDTVDDAFHEIQLSGKQLVFLFMATTVISIVIFLCGVLVGRGVRAEGIGAASGLTASVDPAPIPETFAPEPVVSDPPTPPAEGQLSYPGLLEGKKTLEKLKPRGDDPAPPRPADEPAPRSETPAPVAEAPAPAAEAPAPRAEKPAASGTATSGRKPEAPVASPAARGARPGTWAVQVVSLRDRSGASRIVRRLQSKGYPAFLVAPTPGAPTQLYKVQVGRYGDRSEAQQIEARLKKEEQFDTWIVR